MILLEGELQQLRIPGCTQHNNLLCPIAIETCNIIYAPIHNTQKNISKLIDIYTKQVHTFTIDPYGQDLGQQEEITPWIFSNKHYDLETNLVYFGTRYYNPSLRQWISPDAIENPLRKTPYQYCLGNPFFYFDPDGNFSAAVDSTIIVGAPLIVVSTPILAPGAALMGGVTIGYYGSKKIKEYIDNRNKPTVEQEERSLNQKYPRNPVGGFTDKKRIRPGNIQRQIDKGYAPKSIVQANKAR